jgi:serine/threonine protein kinase
MAGARSEFIVTVFDAQVDDQEKYFVMEWFEGHDLGRILEKGPIDPARAVALMNQVLEGIEYCHENEDIIIHRDIKPSNLIVLGKASREKVKIIDFGIAKVTDSEPSTRTRQGLGTDQYAAPEQFDKAKEADMRTDVFGVGATLYHCLAGKPPFKDYLRIEQSYKMMQDALPPDNPDLRKIVLKALSHKKDDRFQSAHEFRSALAPFLPRNEIKERIDDRVKRAVVLIVTSDEKLFRGGELTFGTGFFVTEKGHLMTCFHVVQGAQINDVIHVYLHDRRRYRAKLVAQDASKDQAILKIEARSPSYLQLSDVAEKEGDAVWTRGFPVPHNQVLAGFGLKPGYFDGSISSVRSESDERKVIACSIRGEPGMSGSPLIMMGDDPRVFGVYSWRIKGTEYMREGCSLSQKIRSFISENLVVETDKASNDELSFWDDSSSLLGSFLRCIIEINRGKKNESRKHLRDLIGRDDSFYHLGEVLLSRSADNEEEERAHLQEYLRIKPDDDEAQERALELTTDPRIRGELLIKQIEAGFQSGLDKGSIKQQINNAVEKYPDSLLEAWIASYSTKGSR